MPRPRFKLVLLLSKARVKAHSSLAYCEYFGGVGSLNRWAKMLPRRRPLRKSLARRQPMIDNNSRQVSNLESRAGYRRQFAAGAMRVIQALRNWWQGTTGEDLTPL